MMLCSVLLFAVVTNRKRLVEEIFVAGLGMGCWIRCFGCLLQSLQSIVHMTKGDGDGEGEGEGKAATNSLACQMDGVMQTCSFIMQFFCVGCVFGRQWHSVVRGSELGPKHAFLTVACVAVLSVVAGAVAGSISLSSCGVKWWWLVVGLVLVVITVSCHLSTLRCLTMQLAPPTTTISNTLTRRGLWCSQFRWRSMRFLYVLLLGWSLTFVLEFMQKDGPATLRACASFASLLLACLMPVVYWFIPVALSTYPRLFTLIFGWLCIACKGKDWWKENTRVPEPSTVSHQRQHARTASFITEFNPRSSHGSMSDVRTASSIVVSSGK